MPPLSAARRNRETVKSACLALIDMGLYPNSELLQQYTCLSRNTVDNYKTELVDCGELTLPANPKAHRRARRTS